MIPLLVSTILEIIDKEKEKEMKYYKNNLLSKIVDKRILIIGDVMLDKYIRKSAIQKSNSKSQKVVENIPGGAANVAVNVTSLGGQVSGLLSVIGKDQEGELLKKSLRSQNISVDGLITDHDRPTTLKQRTFVDDKLIDRSDFEMTNPLSNDISQKLYQIFINKIINTDVIVISDYAKGVLNNALLKQIIQAAKRYKKAVIVDPKSENFSRYKGTTILVPNHLEAIAATQAIPDIDELSIEESSNTQHNTFVEIGKKLLDVTKAKAIAITLAKEGVLLIEDKKRPLHLPAITEHVCDTTGAGDTFVAMLSLTMALNLDLSECIKLSNYAAGIVVRKPGTAQVKLTELSTIIEEFKK